MRAFASSIDYLSELWAAAKSAGPFGNMFLLGMLYVVDRERRQWIKKNEALNEKLLATTNNAVTVASSTNSLLAKVIGKHE